MAITRRLAGLALAMLTPASGLVSLAACAWVQPAWLDPNARCGGEAAADLAQADWQRAPLVPVVISSGEFQPMVIDLRRNRPYRFVIDNRDDETRVVYAPAFLHASAIGAITIDGEARDDTCLAQLLIPPLSTAEINLKPLRRGQFKLAGSLVPLNVWGAGLGTIRVE